jgi:uroporphyrinogen decarboxylase
MRRERAMAAINRVEPDRVPLDMGSTGGLMVDPVYFKVKELLGIDGEISPYRQGSSANYYDERILETLDIDFRHLWLSSPDKPKSIKNADGTVTDDWQITWSAEGSYPVFFPLKGLSESEISSYKWPEPQGWNTDMLRERARHYFEDTDYCVVAKAVLDGAGILERCYYLRSIDELFVDMIEREDLVHHLIDKITNIEIALWDMYLDAVGPYVQVIQRAADLGTQTSLFMSPKFFRKFFKPAEDKVYRFIKSKAPHVKIWFHSCGAIEPLIGDFLDLGVDILNPVQPLCKGMDSFELKKKYGDKLCFHGGIDIQKALPGSLDDITREVETRINAFAPGGGYILAPANHIQKDTPGENVIQMYRHAALYGKYPLSVK